MTCWLLILACNTGAPVDADNDGWVAPADCDDDDPFVHPHANEFCDGRDDDCDGAIDSPNPLGQQTWYPDVDHDRFGDGTAPPIVSCAPGPAWSVQPGDCDDADPTRFPNRLDGCNGIDDDCDGRVDEDPGDRWLDEDGDGFGDPSRRRSTCDGTSPYPTDCDDVDPTRFPDAPERCDGLDDDCDGLGDDVDPTTDVQTWWPDTDRDGYGVGVGSIEVCVPPTEAWATRTGDCDDLDPNAHPGALQLCTAADTDCNGIGGDAAGWWNPAYPYRIPLTVAGGAPQVPGEVAVDFRAALDAVGVVDRFDPAGLVAVVQDCTGDGGVPLPTAFVDSLATARGDGDPTDPVDDERGLVTFLLDRDAPLVDLYLGGPGLTPTGTASATTGSIGTGAVSATLDRDRAGTIDALSIGATRVASQGDARDGNGVERSGEWTTLTTASSATVLAAGPVFAAVAFDGSYTSNAGTVRYSWWWFGWSGSPLIYGRVVLDADTDLYWDDPADPRLGVRPLELVPLDRGPISGSSTSGFATMSDGAAGAGIGWVTPPADTPFLLCSAEGCLAAASEGQGSSSWASAGSHLIDHRVLAISPFLGSSLPSATANLARSLPTVVASPVEAP